MLFSFFAISSPFLIKHLSCLYCLLHKVLQPTLWTIWYGHVRYLSACRQGVTLGKGTSESHSVRVQGCKVDDQSHLIQTSQNQVLGPSSSVRSGDVWDNQDFFCQHAAAFVMNRSSELVQYFSGQKLIAEWHTVKRWTNAATCCSTKDQQNESCLF